MTASCSVRRGSDCDREPYTTGGAQFQNDRILDEGTRAAGVSHNIIGDGPKHSLTEKVVFHIQVR